MAYPTPPSPPGPNQPSNQTRSNVVTILRWISGTLLILSFGVGIYAIYNRFDIMQAIIAPTNQARAIPAPGL